MCYWWLSFADPDRPEGQQFLGCVITEAVDFLSAVIKSHRLSINPGGEVQAVVLPKNLYSKYAEENYVDRLIVAPEVYNIGRHNHGTIH
jgi:hypothetical protein